MNIEKSVVIVGHMGSGKTTISEKLAEKLGWNFVDSDQEIVAKHGPIKDIFGPDNKGEATFRKIECTSIAGLLEYPIPRIIGVGGGAFIQPNTRAIINNAAISVFLKADVSELLRRIGDDQERPMLKIKDTPEASLEHLDALRGPDYAKALLTVETRNEPEEETLNRLINALYSHCKP